MSEKYKELDAFKENEFKYGDLVRVYVCEGDTRRGIVYRTQGEVVQLIGCSSRFNFKQCRKLTTAEPREFLVDIFRLRIISYDVRNLEHSHDKFLVEFGCSKDQVIKVREILED